MQGPVSTPTAGVPALLRPVVAASSRLRTSARLAVLVLVLLVPGLGAAWAYSATVGGQVAFTTAEQSGLRVLRPALVTLADAVGGRPADLGALEAAAAAEPDLDLDAALAAVRTAAAAPDAATPAGRAAL